MKKIEKILKREFNPFEDFKEIKFYDITDPYMSNKEFLRRNIKNFAFYLKAAKPISRGFIVGGALGAATAFFAREDIHRELMYGAQTFMMIDTAQYVLRGMYHYLQKQNLKRLMKQVKKENAQLIKYFKNPSSFNKSWRKNLKKAFLPKKKNNSQNGSPN